MTQFPGAPNGSDDLDDDIVVSPDEAKSEWRKNYDVVSQRVDSIVDDVRAEAMEAIAQNDKRYFGHLKLIEGMTKIDASIINCEETTEVDYQTMKKVILKCLRQLYKMMMKMGFTTQYRLPANQTFALKSQADKAREGTIMIVSDERVIRPNFEVDQKLLVIAAKLLRQVDGFDEDGGEIWSLSNDISIMLSDVLRHVSKQKLEDYQQKKTSDPLDLNLELLLLKYLDHTFLDEELDEIFAEVAGLLHYQSAVKEKTISGHKDAINDSLQYLAKRGLFGEMLEFRRKYPRVKLHARGGDALIEAHTKQACFLKYDENGMPFSNDVTPQYPWADFRVYRQNFKEAYKAAPHDDGEKGSWKIRNDAIVKTELMWIRRASVAELLRKLVNKDLDYGEGSDASTTSLSLYGGSLDRSSIRSITCEFDDVFEATNVPIPYLFKPLERALNVEMEKYAQVLQRKYGTKHKILPSRVKSLESTLLKMLKEGKTSVGTITDLIGFTILTDTEKEAEDLYAEIKASMSGKPDEIKEALTWAMPTRRGYKSMDITGVPEGFSGRIQVQCRTKKLDEENYGKFSNHEAYKVFSGTDLLKKITADPNAYFDQLYKILHNLAACYHYVQNEENDQDLAVLMEIYTGDYEGGMSIIRTSRLY